MIDGDTEQTIMNDVGAGIDPKNSRLEYTPEMLARRKRCEDWWATVKDRPGATLHIPNELPREDIKIQLPTGYSMKDGKVVRPESTTKGAQ